MNVRNRDDFLGVIAGVLRLHDIMRCKDGKVLPDAESGPSPSLPGSLNVDKGACGYNEADDGRVMIGDTDNAHQDRRIVMGASCDQV